MKNRKRAMVAILAGVAGILAVLYVQVFSGKTTGNADRIAFEKKLRMEMLKNASVMPEEKEEGEGEGKPADFPQMDALQDFYLTMDPALGRVPRERLVDAWQYTRSVSAAKPSLVDPVIQWNNIPSVMGGRIRALVWDPNDVTFKRAWAGSVTGGLWVNNDVTNAASSWTAVDDFWSGLSVSAIAFDPIDPLRMYVGTGEAPTSVVTYRESSGLGVGIFTSVDGGQTWSLMPSTQGFSYINDIVVRNESGQSVIYAGIVSGRYMGATHQSQPTDGLYRSTDNGATWAQVLPNITGQNTPYAVSDIEVSSGGRIFVGTQRNLDGNGGATILYSNTGLAGSWTKYEDVMVQILGGVEYYLPGRVMLACAPSAVNTVYATIAAGYTSGFEYYHGKYILKSTNNGVSWTQMPIPADVNGKNWATIAWHALTIAVDPTNANTVWVGGLDINRSTNGGQNWTRMTDWSLMYSGGGNDYVHADIHAIRYKNGSNSQMIVSSDGGVFITNNAATSSPDFAPRSKNLSTLQFYSCDLNYQAASNELIGGLQDNGSLWYTGTSLDIDDMVSGGDGAYCFFDKDDPGLLITSVYYNVYYVFTGGTFTNYVSDYQSGYFINPADYEYRFNTLYANAVPMYGSGPSDQILRISDLDGMANGEFLDMNTGSTVPFSHVTVSPNSTISNIRLFVGSMSGRLFKVTNAQAVPLVTEIGGSTFPTGAISSVAVGHSDDTLLVTFSNYGVVSVWQTYNGGQTWKNAEGNLPDMPVRWAIFHPQNSQQALIATEMGVWSCSNLGSSSNIYWAPVNQGLANVRVDMLRIRGADNKVVAASHGRGLFTGSYYYDPTTGSPALSSQVTGIGLYPNPSKGMVYLELPQGGATEIRVFSVSGEMVMQRRINQGLASKQVTLDMEGMKTGVYMVDILNGTAKTSKKVVLIR